MVKPGYKTSEFWFTVVSFIFSGLYLAGVISENETKEELIQNVSHAVESCILIGGQALIFYKYVKARQDEKIEYEKTLQKEADLMNEELETHIGVNKTYGKININTATMGELIQLPHIGPSIAKKIMNYREHNGLFIDKKQLIQIDGIKQNTFDEIKKLITI
jgi:competence ComEA-like helix-hairpin-helix protein